MFYLARHGETVWNAAGRFQGQKDSPLTLRGREQAAHLGRMLARLVPRNGSLRAYVSPLGRARETVRIMGEHVNLDTFEDSHLREVTLGSWDGLSMVEIEAEFPGALSGSNPFDWYFRSPDGERLDDAIARVSSWFGDAEGPAVIVAHGLIGRLLRGLYLGLSRDEMLRLPVPQDSLFRLEGGEVSSVTPEQAIPVPST